MKSLAPTQAVALLPKICIILPWFGCWPPWTCLFLKSIQYNPTIKWLIVTNFPLSYAIPENVNILETSKEKFQGMVAAKTGLYLNMKKARKVCDARPLFGDIFNDFLEHYEFWGYCDVDVIFGNIRTFFPPQLLANNVTFSSSAFSLVGSLSLFRNERSLNESYKKLKGLADALERDGTIGLDELHFHRILKENCDPSQICLRQLQYPDVRTRWSELMERDGFIYPSNGLPRPILDGESHWHDGKVFHTSSGLEMALFHFRNWKHTYNRQPVSTFEVCLGEAGFKLNDRCITPII